MAYRLFTFYVCLLLSQFSTLVVSQWIGNQGEWQLLHESIGISAMHMQLLHNNKVVMFDRTDFGTSNLSLPLGRCRIDSSDVILKRDCSAHSIMYDIKTNAFRPLMVQTDTWCSSGAVLQNGTLVQTGGYNDGDHVIRTIDPCGDWSCDWHEFPGYLSQRRWYATNQILPDGRIIIVGGRRQFNYEFYPRSGRGWSQFYLLNFLRETNDESENNLYPFVHLLPDGNLFIFANTRSIAFDYKNNRVIKEFPSIVGDDPRNYPSSGSSVMLPIDENENKTGKIVVEIMVCGGAPRKAFPNALQGTFVKAISSCGRLKISDENPSWVMETMPLGRVMGDMLLLPNDDVIIVNGAASGTAGWENARNPVTRPVIYHPNGDQSSRFSVMQATIRPRLYHSTAILLTDGRVLVGGSNPHVFYNFSNVDYPTDLSLEAFLPPYLAEIHDELRPTIVSIDDIMGYDQSFTIIFRVPRFLGMAIVSAKIIAPSFTTHSFAMNQRTVVLRLVELLPIYPNVIRLSVVGPSTREIAPPGYYLLFVVHSGVPSSALWVKVQ